MKKQKLKIPIKLIIVVIFIFLGLFTTSKAVRNLKNADYFIIREIIANEPKADLSYLKGKNIFTVDLNQESRNLLSAYPGYKKIRLVRILPNRLFADFVKRRPLAYVKLYRYFCVDSDSVLFNSTEESINPDLPVIFGLETKIFGPKLGKRYELKELLLALNIIKESNKNNIFKDYRIKKIDAINVTNTLVFLSFLTLAKDYRGGATLGSQILEVKISEGQIIDKINLLASLLTQLKNELDKIKYIDLRFKEPVVKFKEK